MATSSLPSPTGFAGLTYARARLWLGITGVGTMVVLAAAALLFDLPARFLPGDPAQPLAAAVAQVLAAMLVPTLLLVPLDLLGGRVVVRDRRPAAAWAAGWARGVAAQFLVWGAAAALVMGAARVAGAATDDRAGAVTGALVAVVAVQAALVALRVPLARLVGGLRVRRLDPDAPGDRWLRDAARRAGLAPDRLRIVDASGGLDTGFVGGWTGVGTGTLLVPAHWAALPADALTAQLARRWAVAERGLHTRGVLGALQWNVVGAALVLVLADAADPTTAAGLVTFVAWATLWSFLGALVLPTPSRQAVFAADAAAARRLGAGAARDAVVHLDRWQDDEAERPAGVETVFHPVPSRGPRLARLGAGAGSGVAERLAAHQLARHALFLAWGALSPLARAVHCNVGRPALWVFWPGD